MLVQRTPFTMCSHSEYYVRQEICTILCVRISIGILIHAFNIHTLDAKQWQVIKQINFKQCIYLSHRQFARNIQRLFNVNAARCRYIYIRRVVFSFIFFVFLSNIICHVHIRSLIKHTLHASISRSVHFHSLDPASLAILIVITTTNSPFGDLQMA